MTELYIDETLEPGADGVADSNIGSDVRVGSGQTTVGELLRNAAELAAGKGASLDAFVNAAARAFLDANPGVRERLEEAQMLAELEALRRVGRVGEA
jgi:hypothetical protein